MSASLSGWTHALAALGPSLALAMLRGAAVLLLALLARRALPRSAAALRQAVLVSALAAQGALLAHALLAPEWRWRVLPLAGGWQAEPAGLTGAPGPLRGPDGPEVVLRSAPSPATPLPSVPAGARLWLVASAVWLAGAVAMLARTAAGIWTVHGIVRGAERLTGGRWERLGALGRRRFSIRRPVHVLVSDAVETPVTCGVLRPRILLPPSSRNWSLARCRVVVFHECAHVAGLDAAAQLVGHLVTALCWINPLAHMVARAAEEERERAADAAVIAAGVRPSSYARHVVEVVRHARRRDPRLAVALGPGGSPLERRLREVLAMNPGGAAARRVPPGTSAALAALCVPLALVAPATGGDAVERGSVAVRLGASGCDYTGGMHLNRSRSTADGRPVWDAAWTGDGCEVRWRAVGSARPDPAGGAVALATASDSLELVVTGGSRPLRLRVHRESRGTVYDVVTADAGAWRSDRPPAGLRDLVVELDRHTAFAVEERLPAIARSGGLPAVMREAAAMQGDHAAAVYLARAVELLAPPEREIRAVLAAARTHASNDYELGRLLGLVAARYGLRDEPDQEEFLRVAARLDARAAREDAIAALRRGRRLAPRLESVANTILAGR